MSSPCGQGDRHAGHLNRENHKPLAGRDDAVSSDSMGIVTERRLHILASCGIIDGLGYRGGVAARHGPSARGLMRATEDGGRSLMASRNTKDLLLGRTGFVEIRVPPRAPAPPAWARPGEPQRALLSPAPRSWETPTASGRWGER